MEVWKVCLAMLLLVLLVPTTYILICTWAAIEQRVYLSRVLPVLREVSSPDDPRLKAIEGTDALGFDIGSYKMRLRDGWVIYFERGYAPADPDICFRERLEHEVSICKDSNGKIYVRAQGFFPPDQLNEAGQRGFDLSENESVTDYFKPEQAIQGSGWDFWEVK